MGHRPAGHGRLGFGDIRMRSQRAGGAITARPIRAAQAAVSQARKSAKQDQIKGEKQREYG